MPKDVAVEYWNILFKTKKYALKVSDSRIESWLAFINAGESDPRRQNISWDTWRMFYKFVEQYPDDNSLKDTYDEMASWPLLIDEYYEDNKVYKEIVKAYQTEQTEKAINKTYKGAQEAAWPIYGRN